MHLDDARSYGADGLGHATGAMLKTLVPMPGTVRPRWLRLPLLPLQDFAEYCSTQPMSCQEMFTCNYIRRYAA